MPLMFKITTKKRGRGRKRHRKKRHEHEIALLTRWLEIRQPEVEAMMQEWLMLQILWGTAGVPIDAR